MTQNSINTDIPIEVSNGGTGASTLTDHGVLLGSGTSPITATAVGATGTVLIGTTATDASFSATPVVTSIGFGDEPLDTYDEGTWTPALEFGGASVGITYATQTGTYTRIGRSVFIVVQLTITNKGSSVGNAAITGLPFTIGSVGTVTGEWGNITFTANYDGANGIMLSGTDIDMRQSGESENNTYLTNTNFENATEINMSGFYFV